MKDNKLVSLDEEKLANFIYKKRVNSDSITLAKYICFKFGKPEIKLPTSKLSPDDIKDGWDAGYVRGWEEYDEGLKRLNGLEAK